MLARQRAERHPVRADLLTDTSRTATGTWGSSDRITARVRWTAADGSTRTDTAAVHGGQKTGSGAAVRLDARDEPTSEPTSPTETAAESAYAGLGVSLAPAGTAIGAGAVVRRRLGRRSLDAWNGEWDSVEPRRSHRTG